VTCYRRNLRRNGTVSKQLGNALFAVGTVVEMDSHQNRMLAAAIFAMNKNLVCRHGSISITATRLFQNIIFAELNKSAPHAIPPGAMHRFPTLDPRARLVQRPVSGGSRLYEKDFHTFSALEGNFLAPRSSAAAVSSCFHR
jgi:hypothetical protein